MCGIAGRSGRQPMADGMARRLAADMQRALGPRGPDGERVHHDGDVLLVHRRLAILDLSDAGAQPLWNEERTVCVLVNGEVYNFRALRRRLERLGHRFRSHSDSEVLVHLYEQDGIEECCQAAEGMFAFALFDARTRDLFVVRDRLGIKPLVIAEHTEGVTFASTLRGVLADWAVRDELRPEALAAVLRWGFVPSPWSAVRAARRVAPGTWLRVRNGRVVEERRWWTDRPDGHETNDSALRATIVDAVRSHLVADVPVGTLMSAGIDSGIVTAIAARSAGSEDLAVWTVSHRDCEEDEFADASRAAAHHGIAAQEIPVGGRGLTQALFNAVIAGMDEPLAVTSLVGLHQLFRAIARRCRVVLSGDGGDELFAGYDWHRGMPGVPAWASTGAFRGFAPWLARLGGVPGRVGVVGKVAARVRRHPASVYLDKLRMATDEELMPLGIAPGHDEAIEAAAVAAWDRFAEAGLLEQMLAVDRATALADEMLAKVDTASMAYSVEARVPLLADRVVAAAKGVPAERKRQGDVGKLCLREWYAELGPAELAWRRKTGFNSPVAAWLHGPAERALAERIDAGRELLDIKRDIKVDSARVLFALAVLGTWARGVRVAAPASGP